MPRNPCEKVKNKTKPVREKYRVAVFSGLDPGGGAGLVADIQALTDAGVSIAPVITANTVQGPGVLSRFQVTDPVLFNEQASLVLHFMNPDAVKIGMVGSATILHILSELLQKCPAEMPVILDPVLSATSGGRLADPGLYRHIRSAAPQITVLTPNRREMEWLSERQISTAEDLDCAVSELTDTGFRAILVKGGHFNGDPTDRLFLDGEVIRSWTGRRYSRSIRGTGCRLASFLAGCMAKGISLVDSADQAYAYVQSHILNAIQSDPATRI